MKDKISNLRRLFENLDIYKLDIRDDSEKHASHYSVSEKDEFPSHISVLIISDIFKDKNLISRHRIVKNILKPAFEKGLHAATIKAYTIEELE